MTGPLLKQPRAVLDVSHSADPGEAWLAAMYQDDWAAARAVNAAVLATRDLARPYQERWVWNGRPLRGRVLIPFDPARPAEPRHDIEIKELAHARHRCGTGVQARAGDGVMWGIISAAGGGTRIRPLAFSKEVLPVGSRVDEAGIARPRAVTEYLIERTVRPAQIKSLYHFALRERQSPML